MANSNEHEQNIQWSEKPLKKAKRRRKKKTPKDNNNENNESERKKNAQNKNKPTKLIIE